MWGYVVSAIGFGWLMALSPCPMATNIAAISYIGKDASSTWKVLLSGISYTIGRTVAYTGLAVLLVKAVLHRQSVSYFLQVHMNEILGPLLIILGMILLELISVPMPSPASTGWASKIADRRGIISSGVLGVIFALSFCPISAVYYISMLEQTRESGLTILLPMVFGVTTALPVLVLAFVIALAAKYVGAIYSALAKVEKWLRAIAGVIFILVGIYYCLVYIYEVI